VAGSSACSTPAVVSRAQMRPPPMTGDPVIEADVCHSTCRWPAVDPDRADAVGAGQVDDVAVDRRPAEGQADVLHADLAADAAQVTCFSTYTGPDLPPSTAHLVPIRATPCGQFRHAPGRSCTIIGPPGNHLARYQRAERRGLISRADLAAVVAALEVIAPSVYVIVPGGAR